MRTIVILLMLVLLNLAARQGITASANYALQFDGINDRLVVNPFPAVTGPFTVEAWIQLGSQGGGINPRIVELVGAQDTTFRLELLGNQPGLLERPVGFELHFVQTGRQDVASLFSLAPGTWHHVAGVYDGANHLLYIDGALVGSGPAAGVLRDNSILEIGTGAALTGDNDTFEGLIDEVRIWDYGRTQAEIQATMFVELTGAEDGLLGYWKFNEGSGQVTRDSTPNGHDAILGNSSDPDQHDPVWVALGAPVTSAVGGMVTGMSPSKVVCENKTTKRRITLQLRGATSWDCEAAGLAVNAGDTIIQTVTGVAE